MSHLSNSGLPPEFQRDIAHFARKFGLGEEEVRGAAWEALRAAQKSFDPSKAKFRTHFSRKLENSLKREFFGKTAPTGGFASFEKIVEQGFDVAQDPLPRRPFLDLAFGARDEFELEKFTVEDVMERFGVGKRRAQQKLKNWQEEAKITRRFPWDCQAKLNFGGQGDEA